MSKSVLLYCQGESEAAKRLDKLQIPYTRTETPLKDILLCLDPVCAVFEGAPEPLVEFSRFCLQSNTCCVVSNPKSDIELQIGYENLSKRFEPWVLEKLRGCDYDVAKHVVSTEIKVEDLVSQERLKQLREDSAFLGTNFNVWHYSANDLVVVGAIFFEYTLERLGIKGVSFERLLYLTLVLRACYGFRGYHCFRHIIDVAQYIYYLDRHGWCYENSEEKISGFDAAALLICALGHDLLHPNVTTPTVVKASPEWANKFGCLENFHCTVYISLLKPLLPEVLSPEMIHQLNVLTAATEMRLHGEYMKRPVDDTPAGRENFLCLVLKMADISNCSRVFDSSIRQTIKLGVEIAGEVRVRDELQLSPGQHSATKPATSFGEDEEQVWERVKHDHVAFAKAFYYPIWEVLYEVGGENNKKILKHIKEQFDETTAVYLGEEIPDGFFF